MIAIAFAAALATAHARTDPAATDPAATDPAVTDTAAPSDNDRDGYAEDVDCNDGEARMNPGQLEDCADGLDNDCDGYTDELDADCLPDDRGCAMVPGPVGVLASLTGALLVSGRRRRARR